MEKSEKTKFFQNSWIFLPAKKNIVTISYTSARGDSKNVFYFYNSRTNTPKFILLRLSREKWLLRIITVFFFEKSDLVKNYLAKVLKKVQNYHFLRYMGVAFFSQSIFLKKNCNFFSLLIRLRKLVLTFWLDISILSYKTFKPCPPNIYL